MYSYGYRHTVVFQRKQLRVSITNPYTNTDYKHHSPVIRHMSMERLENLNIGAGDSLQWLVAALVEFDGARNADRSHHRVSIAGTANRILQTMSE